jgi:hypothetical protein
VKREHLAWTQWYPGGPWEPAIPIRPTGLLGWKVRRACRKSGGHYFHANRRWGWSCCECGYEDDNPALPNGHLCAPLQQGEPG